MKNAVFWDIHTQFVPHRRHYSSTTEPSRSLLCKMWGFHNVYYKDCSLLGYKPLVHTSHETHYVSATEPSRLMLCKIYGFHGGDYEQCRILGYKNLLLTSQETHYFCVTEPSRLMLCKIWGFHGVNYDNTAFWDVTLCGSCKDRRFGGK
jgi:hypothetical protein